MHSNVNQMLWKYLYNYKIINKIIKGAFTYYIITEKEGVSKMLMHDYEGGVGRDLALWWHKLIIFLQISGFSLIYINVNNVSTC